MTDEQQYAEGGYIPGGPVPWPGWLDGGYVITREQLEKFDTDLLDRLNVRPAHEMAKEGRDYIERTYGERHDLDDVAREFGIDLNEPEP